MLSYRDSPSHHVHVHRGKAWQQKGFSLWMPGRRHLLGLNRPQNAPLHSLSFGRRHPLFSGTLWGRASNPGNDLLKEAAFSYLHALGVCAHWYATLTLSSCQDASNYASCWSEAERGFLRDETWSMGNTILPPLPSHRASLNEGGVEKYPFNTYKFTWFCDLNKILLFDSSSAGPALCSILHLYHAAVWLLWCLLVFSVLVFCVCVFWNSFMLSQRLRLCLWPDQFWTVPASIGCRLASFPSRQLSVRTAI